MVNISLEFFINDCYHLAQHASLFLTAVLHRRIAMEWELMNLDIVSFTLKLHVTPFSGLPWN